MAEYLNPIIQNDMKLTTKEQKLVAALLRMAAEVYSNHGCNDLDDELFEDWTDKEKANLCKQYCKFNDDEENEEDEGIEVLGQDWILMEFLAHKLDPS